MSHLSLALVLIGVAWLTAAGMAVRTVSRIWLRHWAERRLQGGGAATIYLERPQRLLASAGTGVAAMLLIGGVGAGSQDKPPRLALCLVGFAGLGIILGPIFPRGIAR